MARQLIAFFLSLLLVLLWLSFAKGDGIFMVSINENNRYYRNTGVITLYDPFEDKILGEYKFVTGGAGRGALPFGRYLIGAYRDDPGTSFTRDTQRFRRRWMIKHIGMEDGEALGKDGEKWELLELHSLHASGRTAGCLGVAGGDEVWDDFVSKMNYLISNVGEILFEVAGNPNGIDGPTYVAASGGRHRPHHPTWKRHKHSHIKIAHKGHKKRRHA